MVFSHLLVVMIVAIAIAIFAERRNIQAPLLIAMVGLAASYLPGTPRHELEPEIILTIVLPPLLYSAASEFSFVSFLRRLPSIVNLGVVLVAVTTGFVGAVAAAAIPGMTLPVALVLAAVISPPDAVTAAAIGRKLHLPNRLMTVLKGESLINDAAALTLFSFTAAAVTGAPLFIGNVWLYFLYSAVGGIVVGSLLGRLIHSMRRRMANPSLATALTVLIPFAAYLVAEELHASGVLAVVAAGFALGHNAGETNYATRMQERQTWRTIDTLLEAFVFAYIGLQLRFAIEESLDTGLGVWDVLFLSAIVLVAVILIRIAWVFASAAIGRWRDRRYLQRLDDPRYAARMQRIADRETERLARNPNARRRRAPERPDPFSWRENLVTAWSGMRGVVTLAAAAGIPLTLVDGTPFPQRDLIQAVAFLVTIGTLLIQGLTLPWLIEWLKVTDPGQEAREAAQHKQAETIAQRASVEAIKTYQVQQEDPVTQRAAEAMLARLDAESEPAVHAQNIEPILALASTALAARRKALIAARDAGELDDEVMRETLERMDLEEAAMANWRDG